MNRLFVSLIFWTAIGPGLTFEFAGHAQGPPRGMRFTLRPDMLDLSRCVAEPGAVPLTFSPTNLNLEILDWKTTPQSTVHTGVFLLQLRASMPVGSLITYGASETFYSIKGDWKPLGPESESGRLLKVQAIPGPQRIDGIKIAVPAQPEKHKEGDPETYRATLPFAALVPVRLTSVGQEATVLVSSLSPPAEESASMPWLNNPETLTDGFIDPRRNFSTMDRGGVPTSPEAPEWILMTWPEPKQIRGFAFWRGTEEKGMGDMKIEYFAGRGNAFESGSPDDWHALPVVPTVPGQFRSYQFFVGRVAATSTGLRLSSTGGVDRISLGELSVMSPAPTQPQDGPR